jgi:predicted transposase/invertase (TIGR01784 family)
MASILWWLTMAQRMDPKVDYAFQRVYGTPGHEDILLSFLNAVLEETLPPLVSVTILNPVTQPELESEKLSILDVRALDDQNRIYNVEMQMRHRASYAGRMLYYWADLFRGQLIKGDDYSELTPTIGIHVLNDVMLPNVKAYHSDFQIRSRRDPQTILTPLMQLHIIELPKWTDSGDDMLSRWCQWLCEGSSLDRDAMPVKLRLPPILRALEILDMATMTPQEQAIYDRRRKYQLDYTSDMNEARREGRMEGRMEGRNEGRNEGRMEGRNEGRMEGRNEGRIEARETILNELRSKLARRLRTQYGELRPEVAHAIDQVQDAVQLADLIALSCEVTTQDEFWNAMLSRPQ